MKRIDAIIPEKNLDAVDKSLKNVNVTGITIFNASGRGKNRNEPNQLGHWLYYPVFGEHKVVTVLIEDENVEKIIQAIKENTNAGKIIVTEIENLIDVTNGTIGNQAL
jgi:nitrogen regulatory protein P-II 1